ncbi:hypothetical protein EIP91_008691 [Steccherinum ochraceum]|uniref:Uncharacterized protein n=1 Tax=Steccherinum ochraceum TaxID=92696 RepID=A0A4R0R847_9APHY|nr:hypothetical protein EIP91_008691 [Steccherinum ochraceum]
MPEYVVSAHPAAVYAHSLDVWLSVIDCLADTAKYDVMNITTRFSALYACCLVCVPWHSRASWHLQHLRYVPHTVIQSSSDLDLALEYFFAFPERGAQVEGLEIAIRSKRKQGVAAIDVEPTNWIASTGDCLGFLLPRLRLVVLRNINLKFDQSSINSFKSYTTFAPVGTLCFHRSQLSHDQLKEFTSVFRPRCILFNEDTSSSTAWFPDALDLNLLSFTSSPSARPFDSLQELFMRSSWSTLRQMKIFSTSGILLLKRLRILKLSLRTNNKEGMEYPERPPVDAKVWAGIVLLFTQSLTPGLPRLTVTISFPDVLLLELRVKDAHPAPYLSIWFYPSTILYSRVSSVTDLISGLSPLQSAEFYTEHFGEDIPSLLLLFEDLPVLQFQKGVITVSPSADANKRHWYSELASSWDLIEEALKVRWSGVDLALMALGKGCGKDVVFTSDWNWEGLRSRRDLAGMVRHIHLAAFTPPPLP